MASSRAYLEFMRDQLSGLDGVVWKPMMGEYLLSYHGKILGGIYDDRFLVKPTASARRLMPEAALERPYEGAREMLLVDPVENRDFLEQLLEAMAGEVPAPKKKDGARGKQDRTADRHGL